MSDANGSNGTNPEKDLSAENLPGQRGQGGEEIRVQRGMFGAAGGGDTSGYGGLVRSVRLPGPASRPYGGWFDEVADELEGALEEQDLLPENAMIVTVCELPEDRKGFEHGWTQLGAHVREAGSGLVLLPDMDLSRWSDAWEQRLGELGAALVLGSCPVVFGNERYNEGFVWSADTGLRSVHAEASRDFVPLEIDGVDIGFLIGPEASAGGELPYVRGDVDIVAMPRCTRAEQFAQRLERACAVATGLGAFALSSNRAAPFEGQGWIVAPDGRVLGTTSASQPFVSLQIDLPSERLAANVARAQPVPAWVDPLDTGVPNYD